MVKDTIQQIISMKGAKLFILFLMFSFVLSSCIQLRYTDYGRPLDFLKSRNQHFNTAKTLKDTANICIVQTSTFEDSLKLKKPIVKTEKKVPIENIPLSLASSLTFYDNTNIIKNSKKLTFDLNPKLSSIKPSVFHEKNILNFKPISTNTSQKGPWESFWSFVFKWLLIFLAIFLALVLVIWGIYLLIGLLAGPIAASIFLAIVILLLYIAFEF